MNYWVPIIDLLGVRSAFQVPEEMTKEYYDKLSSEISPFILKQIMKKYVPIGTVKVLGQRWKT